jgi:hypothetical protein
MTSLNYCRSSITLLSKFGKLGLGIVNIQVETFLDAATVGSWATGRRFAGIRAENLAG